MGRPYTGNISTRTYERVQNNGDIYVYEEQKQYDPTRGVTITIGTHLIGKKLNSCFVFTKIVDKVVRVSKCNLNILRGRSAA